jgi:hypothetical protein
MILTTSYRGHTDTKRDLLAAFSSVDHHTSAALDETDLDRVFLRLLLRLAALCSLHGPAVPLRLLEALPATADPFAVVSNVLDTGDVVEPGSREPRRELQQELVHFSRIVDIGTVGFDRPPTAGTKRVRHSHRLPQSLKVLSELMVVARGRLIQQGRPIAVAARRRPGVQRNELDGDALIQVPTHTADHALIAVSAHRRLRLQVGYYFDNLLAYLPPADAFTALTAHLAETAPRHGVQLWLVAAPDAGRVQIHDWTYEPHTLPADPFEAALTLLPRSHEVTFTPGQPVPLDLTTDGIRITYQDNVATITTGSPAVTPLTTASARLHTPSLSGEASLRQLADQAVALLHSNLAGRDVRSIECGHIHLDRQLDADQEAGTHIGAGAYRMLSASQSSPPMLAPMMDDDHVLVQLRPQQYAGFLRRHFPTAPFTLIPESSPIIRAIAVALYTSLTESEQRDRMTTRGRNLFLRLADGSYCELFEDFDHAPVSGCVLFEASLLVYRSDPDAFDTYIQDRFATAEHVHVAAARILDGDEPHDVKARHIAELYRLFDPISDPRRPDPRFADLVACVLAGCSNGVVHLNVLEDYYEVQQTKVRQLIAALGLPIRLLTTFFNTQTGRVAIDG